MIDECYTKDLCSLSYFWGGQCGSFVSVSFTEKSDGII